MLVRRSHKGGGQTGPDVVSDTRGEGGEAYAKSETSARITLYLYSSRKESLKGLLSTKLQGLYIIYLMSLLTQPPQ